MLSDSLALGRYNVLLHAALHACVNVLNSTIVEFRPHRRYSRQTVLVLQGIGTLSCGAWMINRLAEPVDPSSSQSFAGIFLHIGLPRERALRFWYFTFLVL